MDTNKTRLGPMVWTVWAATHVIAIPSLALQNRAGDPCESLLRGCEAFSQETLISERVGLWDALRELKVACDLPEADPRAAAKATFLYLSLPEFSALESELGVLEEVEARLEGVEGGDEVLATTLDWKAATLEGLGREEDALATFERALQFRQERFGRGSAEEAKALLHLGQHYANRAERSGSPTDIERAMGCGESAVRSLWQSRGAKDRETLEILMQFEALLESLGMSAVEVASWTERYRQPFWKQ